MYNNVLFLGYCPKLAPELIALYSFLKLKWFESIWTGWTKLISRFCCGSMWLLPHLERPRAWGWYQWDPKWRRLEMSGNCCHFGGYWRTASSVAAQCRGYKFWMWKGTIPDVDEENSWDVLIWLSLLFDVSCRSSTDRPLQLSNKLWLWRTPVVERVVRLSISKLKQLFLIAAWSLSGLCMPIEAFEVPCKQPVISKQATLPFMEAVADSVIFSYENFWDLRAWEQTITNLEAVTGLCASYPPGCVMALCAAVGVLSGVSLGAWNSCLFLESCFGMFAQSLVYTDYILIVYWLYYIIYFILSQEYRNIAQVVT